MKTSLSASFCAFCAAFGLVFSAMAETETIAYWPFGTNGFHDVSGNGHDLVGVEVEESDDAYISLNQGTTTNQFLRTAAKLDLSGETAVTFECWCRVAERPSGDYGVLFSTPEPWKGTGGLIIYNTGLYQAQMRTSTDGWHLDCTYKKTQSPSAYQALADDTYGYVDGVWHHVAYVIDRSKGNSQDACLLYLDGVKQKNNNNSGGAPYTVPALFNDFFQIGNCLGYVVGNSYLRGFIDDVRISRGVVDPKDFLKSPTFVKTMSADYGKMPVVAYWPFGNKGGKDATGNGFDLVSSNVFYKSGYANTTWATRENEFACSPSQTIPFSMFTKSGLTVEMFFRSDSSSKILGMLMETGSSYWGNPGAFRISFDANNSGYTTLFSGYHVSGSYGAYSRTYEDTMGDLGDGKWRHLAMVYDPKNHHDVHRWRSRNVYD